MVMYSVAVVVTVSCSSNDVVVHEVAYRQRYNSGVVVSEVVV